MAVSGSLRARIGATCGALLSAVSLVAPFDEIVQVSSNDSSEGTRDALMTPVKSSQRQRGLVAVGYQGFARIAIEHHESPLVPILIGAKHAQTWAWFDHFRIVVPSPGTVGISDTCGAGVGRWRRLRCDLRTDSASAARLGTDR